MSEKKHRILNIIAIKLTSQQVEYINKLLYLFFAILIFRTVI